MTLRGQWECKQMKMIENVFGNTSMQVTFIIGNGFDLGLGMKTRYEDIYKE